MKISRRCLLSSSAIACLGLVACPSIASAGYTVYVDGICHHKGTTADISVSVEGSGATESDANIDAEDSWDKEVDSHSYIDCGSRKIKVVKDKPAPKPKFKAEKAKVAPGPVFCTFAFIKDPNYPECYGAAHYQPLKAGESEKSVSLRVRKDASDSCAMHKNGSAKDHRGCSPIKMPFSDYVGSPQACLDKFEATKAQSQCNGKKPENSHDGKGEVGADDVAPPNPGPGKTDLND